VPQRFSEILAPDFRDESFQTIDYIGNDNQTHNNQEKIHKIYFKKHTQKTNPHTDKPTLVKNETKNTKIKPKPKSTVQWHIWDFSKEERGTVGAKRSGKWWRG